MLIASGILQNIPAKLLNELIGQNHPRQINNSFLFHADGSCLSGENLQAVFLWDSQFLIQFGLKSLAGRLDWELSSCLHSSPAGSSLEKAWSCAEFLLLGSLMKLPVRVVLEAWLCGTVQNSSPGMEMSLESAGRQKFPLQPCSALPSSHCSIFLLSVQHVSGEEKEMASGNLTQTNRTWQAACCPALPCL